MWDNEASSDSRHAYNRYLMNIYTAQKNAVAFQSRYTTRHRIGIVSASRALTAVCLQYFTSRHS